jgi:glycosyltransferase involved in cell wall biosynthesis
MHDLNYLHHPEFIPGYVRLYYNYFFPRFAKKAIRIATVSEFSKADISESFGIKPERIDVVYNGSGDAFKPLNEMKKAEVKERYAKGKEYFMFVGLLHPRKNISNLLKAFDRFKIHTGSDFKLVVVGEKKWTEDISQTHAAMKHGQDVVFTGRLSKEDLVNVMASAFALTYVPFFEGFGIPIIEAMNCDVPVITSNITSMPEVSGDAALLIDPHSVSSISSAMENLFNNPDLRMEMIKKGQRRRAVFSWDRSANLLWACIEKALVK